MLHQINLNKHLFECTLGEFAEAVASFMLKEQERVASTDADMHKGIKGIMNIFNCSEYTARKIKNSGIIDDAIMYFGTKTFATNKEKALKLYNNKNNLI